MENKDSEQREDALLDEQALKKFDNEEISPTNIDE